MLADVAFRVKACEEYWREGPGTALHIFYGVRHLLQHHRGGLFAGHVLQEGEVEDHGRIAPRVALSYYPPLFENVYCALL